MGLPLSFLLGIAVLLLHDQLPTPLPGTASVARLLPYLLLVPVPWLLVRALTRAALRQVSGRRRRLSLLARLLPLTVPIAFGAMVVLGNLPAVADAFAGESSLLTLVLTLAPLLAMELSYRGAEARLAEVDRRGLAVVPPPGYLALVWLIVAPIAVLAAATDFTRDHRVLQAFFTATTLGQVSGLLGAVFLLSFCLPLLFRWFLPTSRRLPPTIAGDIHATARALGFAPRQVLSMRTDMRMANAAMVGPLPWPRYLVLTDALMALLDVFALRGVVAHEVGHARAGHPLLLLLLFVVTPVLAFPATWLILQDADLMTQLAVGAVAFVVGVLVLRAVAHRFEFEADQLSAVALGGAMPCIEALRQVGLLSGRASEDASLRHPASHRRIALLQRLALDADARARFARGGRRMRVAIGALTVAALLSCAWAQTRTWPVDRALLAYADGAFPEAKRRLDALALPVPAALQTLVDDLREEVAAALILAPAGGAWPDVRATLATGGMTRGTELLREGDARAALPWLSLALSDPRPAPWRRTLYLLAQAAVDGDAGRVQILREHLGTLAAPAEVVAAVQDLRAAPDARPR